ncbi:M20 family metallopeptidase [Glutamicibacter sp. NPDC087344]|uniref:M20 family metallopeptidase n=1 Tax=Glutamicibacter sp. NPDC087344 TaxID=3363994 RepID=UPI003809ADC0
MELRQELLRNAERFVNSGALFTELSQLVGVETVSGSPAHRFAIDAYLDGNLRARFDGMGFSVCADLNWRGTGNSFLRATRIEDPSYTTVLCYGHADVVDGQADQWAAGRDPFVLRAEGDRWYGRGAADNKGQHLVNLTALELLLAQRGSLGFNVIFLFESGEEIGSPQLHEYAAAHRQELAADVFIASDGPRQAATLPTIFLGARGGASFELSVPLRSGGYHSGNWGGILRNPATTLAGAISELVDGHGRIRLPELLPDELPSSVRQVLRSVAVGQGAQDPDLDAKWADPNLSAAERLYGWNTLEVLAMNSADVNVPVNAIPGQARAVLQLRYVVGTDIQKMESAIRKALDHAGYHMVQLTMGQSFEASRIEPDNPWVGWVSRSLQESTGQQPVILPNIGGSLPNAVFESTLDLPTLWIPHSYPGCQQHGPNEHALESVLREGLKMMCGLFHDLGTRQDMPRAATLASKKAWV